MNKKMELKISTLRKRRRITQQELADVLGVSFQTISKWENGVTMPDITMLPILADYFEVSVDELLGLKAIQGEEYISGETGMKEFWNKKLEYLLRTRKTYWNTDYMKFLIDTVWHIDGAVDILDCGCGYGFLGLMMMPLLPKGSTYTGVDFANDLMSHGEELFRTSGLEGRFVTGDFNQISLGHKYDVVICQAVLRHLDNAESFMERMITFGKEGALIVCIDVNRELETNGLYVEGMDYAYLCEHSGMKKYWKTELERQGRDYAVAMRNAYSMKKLGLREIEVRMNDRVSFVHPEINNYQQMVDDMIESKDWKDSLNEKERKETIRHLMNHGMDRKEAEDFCDRKKKIAMHFKEEKGKVSYTNFQGDTITFGRKKGGCL